MQISHFGNKQNIHLKETTLPAPQHRTFLISHIYSSWNYLIQYGEENCERRDL